MSHALQVTTKLPQKCTNRRLKLIEDEEDKHSRHHSSILQATNSRSPSCALSLPKSLTKLTTFIVDTFRVQIWKLRSRDVVIKALLVTSLRLLIKFL